MKRWKARLMAASLVAVAMLFAVSGFTATAQVVNQDVDAYVCQDLDGDALIDTCSTCFDTDGDGLVECYEDYSVFDRIGQPIDSNGGPVDFNDPVNSVRGPTGLGGPVDFNDSAGFDGGSAHPEEGPIGSDAGKDGEDPIASDAGKREE